MLFVRQIREERLDLAARVRLGDRLRRPVARDADQRQQRPHRAERLDDRRRVDVLPAHRRPALLQQPVHRVAVRHLRVEDGDAGQPVLARDGAGRVGLVGVRADADRRRRAAPREAGRADEQDRLALVDDVGPVVDLDSVLEAHLRHCEEGEPEGCEDSESDEPFEAPGDAKVELKVHGGAVLSAAERR